MIMYFKTNDTEYSIYNDMEITKIEDLSTDLYDREDLGYNMYIVTLENGIKLNAFEDEVNRR